MEAINMKRKFSFIEYLPEIQTVARVNKVDISVAYDKFRAGVRAAQFYRTTPARF
jgi:hypothetical protein